MSTIDRRGIWAFIVMGATMALVGCDAAAPQSDESHTVPPLARAHTELQAARAGGSAATSARPTETPAGQRELWS